MNLRDDLAWIADRLGTLPWRTNGSRVWSSNGVVWAAKDLKPDHIAQVAVAVNALPRLLAVEEAAGALLADLEIDGRVSSGHMAALKSALARGGR